jgi:hypothetical protein
LFIFISSLSLQEILESAAELFKAAETCHTRSRISSASQLLRESLPKDKRGLKWFLTPHEAVNILTDKEKRYLEKKPYKLVHISNMKEMEKEMYFVFLN